MDGQNASKVGGQPTAGQSMPADATESESRNGGNRVMLRPPSCLVHELFEEQVRRTPDIVAIVCEDRSLTYSELNAKCNQLARYLVNHDIGPDELVGICLDRSLEMVIGLIAILKAGGAYLPLDPNYPPERLEYMVRDAGPRVLLTHEELRAMLPTTRAEVVPLNIKLRRIGGYIDENLSSAELGLSCDNLIYVIYTSGSTGRPKGTAMTHGAMANLIDWHHGNFPESGVRVLQFAALSFDVAFQETFTTLCTGGTLVMLQEWVRRDAASLYGFLRSSAIQRLFLPPLMLQTLAQWSITTGSQPLSALKDVIVAGEQLRISPAVSQFFNRLDGCRLHNHYGPTETHVVTALTLRGDPNNWPALPAIGRPIANTRIYVLDQERQPVPVGIAGEIYIGGAGVARGYLGRAQLTAERFVTDPFSSNPRARMYKTGDVGRWKADGILEYLGRNDDQVKIRGFRIELGEIEAHLARHCAIREAVVVAREDEPGEKRLVAYVIPVDRSAPLSAEVLRAHLQAVLPDHMLPGAFVVLDTFPLTPNGKLDRRALPVPERAAYVSGRYEAPEGEVEQLLAQLWQELLHVPRVGRHDNFFQLGGHSLLAMQMIVRIRSSLLIDIPLSELFNFSTVRDLSIRIETLRQQRLFDQISRGGDDIQELINEVAAMPEARVRQLMQELTAVNRSP